ncbi:hypothetical protein Tco_1051589, partial [Tanacetum coccineum]
GLEGVIGDAAVKKNKGNRAGCGRGASANVEEDGDKKTFFNLRICVNPHTIRHYGKHAAKKVPFLERHQKDGAAFEGDISISAHA